MYWELVIPLHIQYSKLDVVDRKIAEDESMIPT